MISKFFINRPIFATVIAIVMVLVGLVTIYTLPVAQFPDITPPTVQVTAVYPGASAETVAKTVGVPRGAGERCGRNDLYEFIVFVVGAIYTDRYFRGGNRYRYGDRVGTEPGEHSAGKFTGGCHTTGNYHEEAVYQHRHVLGVGIG